MTEILGGCTNIDRVGGYVNHSAKRENIYFLRSMWVCGGRGAEEVCDSETKWE